MIQKGKPGKPLRGNSAASQEPHGHFSRGMPKSGLQGKPPSLARHAPVNIRRRGRPSDSLEEEETCADMRSDPSSGMGS